MKNFKIIILILLCGVLCFLITGSIVARYHAGPKVGERNLAQIQVRELSIMVQSFRLNNGKWLPSNNKEFAATIIKNELIDTKYKDFSKEFPKDGTIVNPWGNPLEFKITTDDKFVIISKKNSDPKDDIVVEVSSDPSKAIGPNPDNLHLDK